MRSKRPPALSFLLRMATARRAGAGRARCWRSTSPGVALAIFTALVLKEAVHGHVSSSDALHETERIPAVRLPAHGAAVRALGPVRRARRCAPASRGSSARSSRWPFVALIFAVVSGEHFSSYYLFYGSLAFAVLYVSSLRYAYERAHRRAAARRRLPAPRGARRHRQAHPRRRPRARDAARTRRSRSSASSRPQPLPANGLRSLGSLGSASTAALAAERVDEVIIADPDFPQVDAVELVDQCHQRGVRVRSRRRRWRS